MALGFAKHTDRRAIVMRFKVAAKRSAFIVSLVRACRALVKDLQACFHILRRPSKISTYLDRHPVRKLHLGAHKTILDGWLNTDIWIENHEVVYLDVTHRFPLNDNTIDYIYAEHMIEHMDYESGEKMLSECLRVLKPGGRVRFATPDLKVLLDIHDSGDDSHRTYVDHVVNLFLPKASHSKDVFVINNAFRAWGHLFLYDKKTLREALSAQGFRGIEFYRPSESRDQNLAKIDSHGSCPEAKFINNFETIVVEAQKANDQRVGVKRLEIGIASEGAVRLEEFESAAGS